MKRHLSFVTALGMCFFASIAAAYAQVRAETGSIAIGGSVTSSTVIIGIPQEKVDELVRDAKRPLEELTTQQKENIALLKEKLDLNVSQVRAALGILGEKDIPPERLAAKLVEIAERFKDLQTTALAQPEDSPTIVSLRAEAQKAIEAGELAKADALLADVETEQRRSLDRLAINAAETSARRGEIALTRLRYREAATHFANAAAVFPPKSAYEDKRLSYLRKEAAAVFQQGDEFGDNGALLSAIEQYTRLVNLEPRQWARTQYALGLALLRLGERESGTARLEEAVAAHREALKEWSRELLPLDWAKAQNSLGWTLFRLGEHESGTAKLEEAVAAYREALKEQTHERAPLDWANTQNSLGVALMRLEERESGTTKLQEAAATFREALKEWTREREPRQWAATQNNLGNALLYLGRRESGTAKLEEAVAAYREVLQEQTRERMPLEWARTQNNLGNALATLGGRESGTAKLEEAVAAYREALKERARERVPLRWARGFGNEGIALMLLAERRGDAGMAETALSQINVASETIRDVGNAPSAAYYEQQLPRARAIVARLRGQ